MEIFYPRKIRSRVRHFCHTYMYEYFVNTVHIKARSGAERTAAGERSEPERAVSTEQ